MDTVGSLLIQIMGTKHENLKMTKEIVSMIQSHRINQSSHKPDRLIIATAFDYDDNSTNKQQQKSRGAEEAVTPVFAYPKNQRTSEQAEQNIEKQKQIRPELANKNKAFLP